MVTNVTSLTGNGLKDWLIQRLTAVYLAAYTILLLVFFLKHSELHYQTWRAFFEPAWMKIASAVALFAFLLHTWIGIWTVTTDYMTCKVIRMTVQYAVGLWLLWQLIWGFMIVWGQA